MVDSDTQQVPVTALAQADDTQERVYSPQDFPLARLDSAKLNTLLARLSKSNGN
jgi:hypothetical protein